MKQKRENLWIVVEVQSGIAVNARAYKSGAVAERRFSRRQKAMNLQEDDVQMFEVRLPKL